MILSQSKQWNLFLGELFEGLSLAVSLPPVASIIIERMHDRPWKQVIHHSPEAQLPLPKRSWRQGRQSPHQDSQGPHGHSGPHTLPSKLIKEESRLRLCGPPDCSENSRLEVSLALSILLRERRRLRI